MQDSFILRKLTHFYSFNYRIVSNDDDIICYLKCVDVSKSTT